MKKNFIVAVVGKDLSDNAKYKKWIVSLGFNKVVPINSLLELQKISTGFKNIIMLIDLDEYHFSSLVALLRDFKKRKDITFIFTSHQDMDSIHFDQNNSITLMKKPILKNSLKLSLKSAYCHIQREGNIFSHLTDLIFQNKYSSKDIVNEMAHLTKLFRGEHELTQQDLAKYLGISTRHIQRIESGNSNVTLNYLFILLKGISDYKSPK